MSYANGLGFFNTYDEHGKRKDLSTSDFTDPKLRYMSMVPMDDETHGGDDVGVYASGPWSHLFIGNYEQSSIPVAMAYAAQIGPYADDVNRNCNSSSGLQSSFVLFIVVGICNFFGN